MPFLSHGSYRIRYELEGPADAPVYVLVNGLTQYAELWTAYRDALVARRFRVATFDLLARMVTDGPGTMGGARPAAAKAAAAVGK